MTLKVHPTGEEFSEEEIRVQFRHILQVIDLVKKQRYWSYTREYWLGQLEIARLCILNALELRM